MLTIERVRKFARRARRYIQAYYVLEHVNKRQGDGTELEGDFDEIDTSLKENGEHVTPKLIENLVKAFKSHRAALDFDRKFIKSCMRKESDALAKSSSSKIKDEHKPGVLVEHADM